MIENKKIKLPNDFTCEMKKILGSDFDKYISSMEKEPVKALRINKKRISADELSKQINTELHKIEFSDDGFTFCTDEKLGNTPAHLSGLFYIQEPSSMVPVISSEIDREDNPIRVLDLCASPGGKSSQIADKVPEGSIIISNEIVRSRAEILYSNIERQGFRNVVITNEPPENFDAFSGYFDYVFVDAPCSGEGMFRKNPETISEWSKENVALCARRQKTILEVAEKLVSAGGKLIYSTCTFSEDEDENIVKWFTDNFNFEVANLPEKIKKVTLPAFINGDEYGRKFFPFTGDGEGQFVCVLKNKDEFREQRLHKKKHFSAIEKVGHGYFELINDFMKNNLTLCLDKKRMVCVGSTVFFVPEQFDDKLQTAFDSLKFLSIGVKLGTIEKNRFEPNHAMFMCFSELFKHKIELFDDVIAKYLHGDEIEYSGNEKGYCVLTKNGYPIGGAKISSGKLKNLYPRGKRI